VDELHRPKQGMGGVGIDLSLTPNVVEDVVVRKKQSYMFEHIVERDTKVSFVTRHGRGDDSHNLEAMFGTQFNVQMQAQRTQPKSPPPIAKRSMEEGADKGKPSLDLIREMPLGRPEPAKEATLPSLRQKRQAL